MSDLKVNSIDTKLFEKYLPIIALIIPWEIYFYSGYSHGWGIKFSLFYSNFDDIYGTLFVNIIQQMSLLSYGGVLASARTVGWILSSILCIVLAVYELLRPGIRIKFHENLTADVFTICGIFMLVSSLSVWNSGFQTLPIAPFFFGGCSYILRKKNEEYTEETKSDEKLYID